MEGEFESTYIGEPDEEDLEIERDFQMEDQKETQDELYGDQTPNYNEKDDLWSLFWKVIAKSDSSKVGNLNKAELGMLDISVRDCLRISRLAETLGHPGFSKYFKEQAELILATSCSREGHLLNLFVSQKKFSSKSKGEGNIENLKNQPTKRKSLFKR